MWCTFKPIWETIFRVQPLKLDLKRRRVISLKKESLLTTENLTKNLKPASTDFCRHILMLGNDEKYSFHKFSKGTTNYMQIFF